jgi:hypothetical protein
MSLINDALKRASQGQAQRPAAPAAPPHTAEAPPMKVVEKEPYSGTPVLLIAIIGVVVLLLVCAGFGLFLLQSKQPVATNKNAVPAASVPVAVATPAAATKAEVPVAQKPIEAPKTVTVPPASPPVVGVASTVTAPVATPESAIAEPNVTTNAIPTVAPTPAPPAVPTFPSIKLQGIFYKKSNPTAMLNGKTVGVGGKVDGVTVTQIEASSVTLKWNDEKRVLELQ